MKEWGKCQEQDYGEGPKKDCGGRPGGGPGKGLGEGLGVGLWGMARDRTRERTRVCGWGGGGGSVKISRLVQGQHPMEILQTFEGLPIDIL